MSKRRNIRNAIRRRIKFWCEGTDMTKIMSKGKPGLMKRWFEWEQDFIRQRNLTIDHIVINGMWGGLPVEVDPIKLHE